MDRVTPYLILTAIVVFGACICLPADDAEPYQEETITALHGAVYDIPAQHDREPLADVKVTTWAALTVELESVYTDQNGLFNVQYSEDVKFISFEMAEYTVKAWCSELSAYGNTGMYRISLKDNSQTGGVHNLYDNSGYSAIMTRSNAAIHGNVLTSIDGDTVYLSNATVTITSNKTTLSTTTDDKGYFEFNCSTGVQYDMKVTCGGFNDRTIRFVMTSDDPLYVELTPKTHEGVFSMDFTHSTAVICLLIITVMVLSVIFLIRSSDRSDQPFVINDLPMKKPKKRK